MSKLYPGFALKSGMVIESGGERYQVWCNDNQLWELRNMRTRKREIELDVQAFRTHLISRFGGKAVSIAR